MKVSKNYLMSKGQNKQEDDNTQKSLDKTSKAEVIHW